MYGMELSSVYVLYVLSYSCFFALVAGGGSRVSLWLHVSIEKNSVVVEDISMLVSMR